jgi:hypothetical protein
VRRRYPYRDRCRAPSGWRLYLTNERSHHMLQLLDAKDKAENLMDSFRNYFR